MDDAELKRCLEAAQTGDDEAFGDVVRHLGARLIRYLTSILRDRSLAEDVAQEAFVRAYRGLSTLRDVGRFRHWLWKIGRCAAIDMKRRLQRPDSAEPDEVFREDLDEAFESERDFDSWERYERLLAFVRTQIEEFPVSTRELVMRRYADGLSYEALAAERGLTLGQVKARLARARARLRRKLSRAGQDGGSWRHELP